MRSTSEIANEIYTVITDFQSGVEEASVEAILPDVLRRLEGDAPARIAVVGMTTAGKSSLINSLFGKDIVEIRATADTTEVVTRLELGHLVLYDTPGLIGEGKLENITRAFVRVPQDSELETAEELPFKKSEDSSAEDLPLSSLEETAPIDTVLFIFDGSRVLNRFEKVYFSDLYKSLKEQYQEALVVGATHSDVLEEKEEDERKDLIKTIENLFGQRAVLVSNKTGEGLEELTLSLFRSLPSHVDASSLQSALRSKRQLSRLNYVMNEVSKMVSDTVLLNSNQNEKIRLNIIATNVFILQHYSVDREEWERLNGNTHKIYKYLREAGREEESRKREPENIIETIFSLFGAEYYKTIIKEGRIGVAGLREFLPEIAQNIASLQPGLSKTGFHHWTRSNIDDREDEIEKAVSNGDIERLSSLIFEIMQTSLHTTRLTTRQK